MQPPKRSRLPANSSIRKLSTMPNRRKMPLPKSNATSSRRVAPTQARPDQAGLVISAGVFSSIAIDANAVAVSFSIPWITQKTSATTPLPAVRALIMPALTRTPHATPTVLKSYWEIGGTGGPGAATGTGRGAEAVIADGGGSEVAGTDGRGAATGSGAPLVTAADEAAGACGAGVTGGTGSGRTEGAPLPLSFDPSIFAASDLPSPAGLVPSGLPLS